MYLVVHNIWCGILFFAFEYVMKSVWTVFDRNIIMSFAQTPSAAMMCITIPVAVSILTVVLRNKRTMMP